MKKLFEEANALLKEGKFYNLLSGGKVPIGQWKFIYSSNDIKFIINSAKVRGMKTKIIDDDIVEITGEARDHESLITSLQSLGVEGNVID